MITILKFLESDGEDCGGLEFMNNLGLAYEKRPFLTPSMFRSCTITYDDKSTLKFDGPTLFKQFGDKTQMIIDGFLGEKKVIGYECGDLDANVAGQVSNDLFTIYKDHDFKYLKIASILYALRNGYIRYFPGCEYRLTDEKFKSEKVELTADDVDKLNEANEIVSNMAAIGLANYWSTGHTTGGNNGNNLTFKFLDAINAKLHPLFGAQKPLSVFYEIAHPMCKGALLYGSGIYKVPCITQLGMVSPKSFHVGRSVLMRLSSFPSGTHRLNLYIEMFKSFCFNPIICCFENTLKSDAILEAAEAVKANPIAFHIGCNVLCYPCKVKYEDLGGISGILNDALAELSVYFTTFNPNSRLAKSPIVRELYNSNFSKYGALATGAYDAISKQTENMVKELIAVLGTNFKNSGKFAQVLEKLSITDEDKKKENLKAFSDEVSEFSVKVSTLSESLSKFKYKGEDMKGNSSLFSSKKEEFKKLS